MVMALAVAAFRQCVLGFSPAQATRGASGAEADGRAATQGNTYTSAVRPGS